MVSEVVLERGGGGMLGSGGRGEEEEESERRGSGDSLRTIQGEDLELEGVELLLVF